MIVAAPAQVVDIISSAADDGQSDSVVVQLDPPELGRVSIDFKFDANGLQHVTITGESSEAMRQLRLMHFELIQALERHGIASSNMTFQQQQNHQQSALPNPFAREPLKSQPGLSETGEARITSYSLPSARTLPGGRLDMKL
jgi:flagellar hook-length control protein FliK